MLIVWKIIHRCTKCWMKCTRREARISMCKTNSPNSTSKRLSLSKTSRKTKRKKLCKIKAQFQIKRPCRLPRPYPTTPLSVKRRKKKWRNRKKKKKWRIIDLTQPKSNPIYHWSIKACKKNEEWKAIGWTQRNKMTNKSRKLSSRKWATKWTMSTKKK